MSLLLNHRDIDVNIRDSSDDTALNWAIDKEHKEIVRMIFGHGQVEKSKKMWKEARKHLLQNKATSKEMIFEFPLIAAINDGEVEIVKWLLEHDDVQINRYPFCLYRVSKKSCQKNVEGNVGKLDF